MTLLDTEPMSILERRGPDSEQLLQRIRVVPLDDLGTTIVSYEEQTRGWFDLIARAKSAEARVRAYAFLSRHLEIYCRIPVLKFDIEAVNLYDQFRKDGIRIGSMDLKIASIAITNNALLLTRNLQDFRKVPGLRVEGW